MIGACRWVNGTSSSVRVCAALVVMAAIATGCNRPIQVQPHVIEDAQLGARVKTALVNDAQLGVRVIEVRVTRGVVTLSGVVGSAAESARAVEIARTVLDVAEVRSLLAIRDPIELGAADALNGIEPAARTDVAKLSASRRLFAIAGSFNARHPLECKLDSGWTVGPRVLFSEPTLARESRSDSVGSTPIFSRDRHPTHTGGSRPDRGRQLFGDGRGAGDQPTAGGRSGIQQRRARRNARS